jgi:hypothetical protein
MSHPQKKQRVDLPKNPPSEDTLIELLMALIRGDSCVRIEDLVAAEGVPLNATLKNKRSTFLHVAACYGHLGIVRWLVKTKRFDLNARLMDGEKITSFTAMGLASANGHLAVVQFLAQMSNMAETHDFSLYYAIQCGQLEVVKWLVLNSLADPNRTFATALAIRCSQYAVARWLLTKGGARMYGRDRHNILSQALAHSMRTNNYSFCDWLVTKGGLDVNRITEEEGDTPPYIGTVQPCQDPVPTLAFSCGHKSVASFTTRRQWHLPSSASNDSRFLSDTSQIGAHGLDSQNRTSPSSPSPNLD